MLPFWLLAHVASGHRDIRRPGGVRKLQGMASSVRLKSGCSVESGRRNSSGRGPWEAAAAAAAAQGSDSRVYHHHLACRTAQRDIIKDFMMV